MILVIFLSTIDFFLTKHIVGDVGFAAEVNPVLRSAMEATGSVYAILWIKILTLALAVALMVIFRDHPKYRRSTATIPVAAVTIGCVAVVCWGSFIVFSSY